MLFQILKRESIMELVFCKLVLFQEPEVLVYNQMAKHCIADKHLGNTDSAAPIHIGIKGLELRLFVGENLLEILLGCGIAQNVMI